MNNIKILLLIIIILLVGCDDKQPSQSEPVKIQRVYSVRLSNSIGSDYYLCDEITKIGSNEYLLKNREDSTYFIDIIVPNNVLLRISNINLENKAN